MALKIFFYIATIFITHHIVAFIQTFTHSGLGHREIGRSLYRTHLYNHHGIYSEEAMVSERYIDDKSLDFYYVIPATIIALLAHQLLPLDLFIVHILSLTLSTSAHLYLHTRYHLRDTWLTRFEWFQKKQQLHLFHHKDMGKNFAVVEFFWDRVLGTFSDTHVAIRN
jgi:hypothetical protein